MPEVTQLATVAGLALPAAACALRAVYSMHEPVLSKAEGREGKIG